LNLSVDFHNSSSHDSISFPLKILFIIRHRGLENSFKKCLCNSSIKETLYCFVQINCLFYYMAKKQSHASRVKAGKKGARTRKRNASKKKSRRRTRRR